MGVGIGGKGWVVRVGIGRRGRGTPSHQRQPRPTSTRPHPHPHPTQPNPHPAQPHPIPSSFRASPSLVPTDPSSRLGWRTRTSARLSKTRGRTAPRLLTPSLRLRRPLSWHPGRLLRRGAGVARAWLIPAPCWTCEFLVWFGSVWFVRRWAEM